MRELDILLAAYLDDGYQQATAEQKQAFCRLVALPDPELVSYLLGGQSPADACIDDVVRQIRGDPHA